MFNNKTSIILAIVAVVFAGIAGVVIQHQNDALGRAITASVLALILTIWAAAEAIIRAIRKDPPTVG